MTIRTLLETGLEFNYLSAYSAEELHKRITVYKNEKGVSFEISMLDLAVSDWNENEENHSVAIYID